jgi:hypothetical protein
MGCDFYGIKEVIEEFDIPDTEFERLSELLGDEYDTVEDYLEDNTSYIVFRAWDFDDDYLRFCRIGMFKCLEILDRQGKDHYIDLDAFEKELENEFYKFTFMDSYGHPETIYIYPLYI